MKHKLEMIPRGEMRKAAAGLVGLAAAGLLGLAPAAHAQVDDQFDAHLSRCRAAGEELHTRLSDLHTSQMEPGSGATDAAIASVTDMQSTIDGGYMDLFGDANTPDVHMTVEMKLKTLDALLDTAQGCSDWLTQTLQAQLDESDRVMKDADAAIAAANATLAKYGDGSSQDSSSSDTPAPQ